MTNRYASRENHWNSMPSRSLHVAEHAAELSRPALFRRVARIVVFVTVAVAMILAGAIILPERAHASGKPTLPEAGNPIAAPNGKVNWIKIKGLSAEWSPDALEGGHYLHASSSYWATTNGSWQLAKKVIDHYSDDNDNWSNYSEPVLGEIYDYRNSSSVPTYKTRLALSLHYSGTHDNLIFPHDDIARTDFFTSAVGIRQFTIPSTDPQPKSRLSVYFTSYKNVVKLNQTINQSITSKLLCQDSSKSCNTTQLSANNDVRYSDIMFRVDDGSPTVWAAVWPNAFSMNGSTSTFNELSGMEVDSNTGYIYAKANVNISGNKSNLDCQTANSSNMNTNCDGTQFLVWDPETGRYAQSREIQPKTINERKKFYLTSSEWFKKTPQELEKISGSFPAANGAYFSQQGFALDKNGNILLLVSNSSNGAGDYDAHDTVLSSNSLYTQTLVKIVPYRDSQGNYAKPQLTGFSDSWTYQVVTKYLHSSSQEIAGQNTSWENGYGNLVISGPISGKLASFGYLGLTYPHPSEVFPGPTDWSRFGGGPYFPSELMISDMGQKSYKSYSILAKAIGPMASEWKNYWDVYNKTNSRPAIPDCGITTDNNFMSTSLSSPSGITSNISGVVWWNKNGNGMSPINSETGKPLDEQGQPRLTGEKLALYEKVLNTNEARLIDTTETDEDGEYSFGTPLAGETAIYYVRLVQPQVDVGSAGNEVAKQVSDSSSSTGYKTIYVSTILDKQGNRILKDSADGKTNIIRNAVEAWAYSTGTIVQYKDDGTIDKTAANNSPNSGLSISTTHQCISGDTFTRKGANNIYDNCYGALQAPYKDQSLPQNGIGTTIPVADIPIYGTVTVSGGNELTSMDARLDFAVTAAGSYGDSPDGPFRTTNAEKGPYLTGIDPQNLHIGIKPGIYQDGADQSKYDDTTKYPTHDYPDGEYTDTHNATDDGVQTQWGTLGNTNVSKDDMNNNNSIRPQHNVFGITINGYAGEKARILGFVSGPSSLSTNKWQCTASSAGLKYNPCENIKVIDQPISLDKSEEKKDGSWLIQPQDWGTKQMEQWGFNDPRLGPDQAGNPQYLVEGKYVLRLIVMPDINQNGDWEKTTYSDNNSGAFDGPEFGSDAANSKDWTMPGEIEDFVMTIRPQDKTIVRFQSLVHGNGTAKTFNIPYTTNWDNVSLKTTDHIMQSVNDHVDQWDKFMPISDPYVVHNFVGLPDPLGDLDENWGPEDPAFTNNQMIISNYDANGIRDGHQIITVFGNKNGVNGLQYDSLYENPDSGITNKDVPPDTKNPPWSGKNGTGIYPYGLQCFERDSQPDKNHMQSIGSPLLNVNGRYDGKPNGVDLRKDYTVTPPTESTPLKIDFVSGRSLHRDSIVTCQVPYAYIHFDLPLAGKTIPWAEVAGLSILLIGITGIAIVLIRRR